MQTIPPGLFWRFQITIHHPIYLKFNISLAKDSLLGIYGRRNIPPTHTQVFDITGTSWPFPKVVGWLVQGLWLATCMGVKGEGRHLCNEQISRIITLKRMEKNAIKKSGTIFIKADSEKGVEENSLQTWILFPGTGWSWAFPTPSSHLLWCPHPLCWFHTSVTPCPN